MSPVYRVRRSSWRQWQLTLALCAVVILSNLVLARVLAGRFPSAAQLALEMDNNARNSRPMQGERGKPPDGQPGANPGARQQGGLSPAPGLARGGGMPGGVSGAEGGPGGAPAAVRGAGPAPGGAPGPALEAGTDGQQASAGQDGETNPVARLDGMLADRIGRIAAENGIPLEQALPSDELRQAALATGQLGSNESQILITEYSRRFRELTGEDMPGE